jgi:hypothetical protein
MGKHLLHETNGRIEGMYELKQTAHKEGEIGNLSITDSLQKKFFLNHRSTTLGETDLPCRYLLILENNLT